MKLKKTKRRIKSKNGRETNCEIQEEELHKIS